MKEVYSMWDKLDKMGQIMPHAAHFREVVGGGSKGKYGLCTAVNQEKLY